MKFSNPDTTSNVIWMSISGSTHREDPQLPHSYYFTTRILVLKFANKGCFLRKSRIHIFLEKRDILVLNSLNLEKKGLILMSSVYCENGIHLGWKVCFTTKKGGFILDWKVRVLLRKGVVLSWKLSVLPQKRGSFSNWRTKMGTTFSSEWESWGPTHRENHHIYLVTGSNHMDITPTPAMHNPPRTIVMSLSTIRSQ